MLGFWFFSYSRFLFQAAYRRSPAWAPALCSALFLGRPRSASQPSDKSQVGMADLQANTNMERISDWLTKILVGAGLVELKGLPRAIDSAALVSLLRLRRPGLPTSMMATSAN